MRERVSKQSAAEAEEAEAEVMKKGKAERHKRATQRRVDKQGLGIPPC